MTHYRFLSISTVALMVLSACTATTPTTEDAASDSSSSVSSGPFLEESSSEGVVEIDVGASSSAAASIQASVPTATPAATRTVKITVSDWSFSPTTITAKKGEKVKLEITGTSGIHGFAVPGLSMNIRVEAGKTVTVDLPTDVAGTFEVICSIPCGSGHKSMKATIVISE